MGLTGIVLIFMPAESAAFAGYDKANILLLQLLGAVYFAFAMINWTAKANLIGGIYGRPIAIGNLTHFLTGALALIKSGGSTQSVILTGTIVYSALALIFGYIFFTHPSANKNK